MDDRWRGRPSSLWHYKRRRACFKHLLEQPKCDCGVGVRFADLSPRCDHVREGNRAHLTLDPEMLTFAATEGVKQLAIIDSPSGAQAERHARHSARLPRLLNNPSLHDSTKCEALLQMHKKLDDLHAEPFEDMETFHKLICLEQDVHNEVGHVLVLQETVECRDRGQLMSEIRDQLARLLSEFPVAAKKLNDELVCRKLLVEQVQEESAKLHAQVGQLTGLNAVCVLLFSQLAENAVMNKNQSKKCSELMLKLSQQLSDSQKAEEHMKLLRLFYENRRQNLKSQLEDVCASRDVWKYVALVLSDALVEKQHAMDSELLQDLVAAAGSVIGLTREWHELCTFSLSRLKAFDMAKLQEVSDLILHQWTDTVTEVSSFLHGRNVTCWKVLDQLEMSIRHMIETFHAATATDKVREENSRDWLTTKKLYDTLKEVNEILIARIELFGGDAALGIEQLLKQMSSLQQLWTEKAIESFTLHPVHNFSTGVISLYPDQLVMLQMNESLDKLAKEVRIELTGENGTVNCLVNLSEYLDTWIAKLKNQAEQPGAQKSCVAFHETILQPHELTDWEPLVAQSDRLLALIAESRGKIGQQQPVQSQSPLTTELTETEGISREHSMARTIQHGSSMKSRTP